MLSDWLRFFAHSSEGFAPDAAGSAHSKI